VWKSNKPLQPDLRFASLRLLNGKKYPGLNHWDTVHQSALDSFGGKSGRWETKIAQQIVDWAKELNEK
jgi:hypothetical protein